MSFLSDYQAVVFDLDGTLLNTLPSLAESVNTALEAYGYPVRSLEQIRSFVGNGVGRLMHCAVPDGTPQEREKQCLALFRKHYQEHLYEKTAPYPEILALLQTLRARGLHLAVVSNKFQEAVQNLIAYYFPNLFDVVIGTSETVCPKPDPQGLLLAIEQMRVTREQTLYIGDSEIDVETAKRAMLDFVGVTWGFRDRFLLRDLGVKHCIDTPLQLLEV